MDDNDSTLAEEQIDRQRRAQGGGASIHQTNHDPRVTAFSRWALVAIWGIGTAIVSFGFNAMVSRMDRMSTGIEALTLAMTKSNSQLEFHSAEIGSIKAVNAEQQAQINENRRDIAVMEGKVFRGVKGYGDAPR